MGICIFSFNNRLVAKLSGVAKDICTFRRVIIFATE